MLMALHPDGYLTITRDAPPPMGSSEAVNSQKTVRTPRGTKGLTDHGKRLIRSGSAVIKTLFTRKKLAFWTLTVPWKDLNALRIIAKKASQILRLLQAKIRYHLEARGYGNFMLGVWEFQKRGALHLHIILPAKAKNGEWLLDIDKGEPEKLWADTLRTICPELGEPATWAASSSIEVLRKDPGYYLSKYLSKGSECVQDIPPPSAWYFCSEKLRSLIAERTIRLSLDFSAGRSYKPILAKIEPLVRRNKKGVPLSGIVSEEYADLCLWAYLRDNKPDIIIQYLQDLYGTA